MTTYQINVGAKGEELAVQFLTDNGYVVVARNQHLRFGEIDIVCRDGPTTVFCEVKTRHSRTFGLPEEALTTQKLRKIVHAAQRYLSVHGLEDADWRIDFIAIEERTPGEAPRIALYKGVGW